MLINREECWTQVLPRSDQDRPVTAMSDLSYLTLQGVPCSLGQVPNHLSHHSSQSSSDTPESWDNGQPRWVPYLKGLPRHFGGLSIFSGGRPSYDLGEGFLGFPGRGPLVCLDPMIEVHQTPWLPRRRSPWSAWTTWWRSTWAP